MRTFIVIIVFIIVMVFTFLGFYNAFYQPKFSLSKEGGEMVVSLEHVGHYDDADSIMKLVFNEVYEKNGIVVTKGYGLYDQYPSSDMNANISFMAGCVIEEKDTVHLHKISPEFIITQLPDTHYIISDFPLKGKLSILFGMKKVYHKLHKFSQKEQVEPVLPVVEIYDREQKRIHYRIGFEKLTP